MDLLVRYVDIPNASDLSKQLFNGARPNVRAEPKLLIWKSEKNPQQGTCYENLSNSENCAEYRRKYVNILTRRERGAKGNEALFWIEMRPCQKQARNLGVELGETKRRRWQKILLCIVTKD